MHVWFFTVRGGFARVRGHFARVRGVFARVRGTFARVRGTFARVRGILACWRIVLTPAQGQLVCKSEPSLTVGLLHRAPLRAWIKALLLLD